MSHRRKFLRGPNSRGLTLIEILIALSVLSLGILAFARVYPIVMRTMLNSRMTTTATQYANEGLEVLRGKSRNNSLLTAGRHPASGFDTLGTSRAWRRCYVVTQMAAPLDSLLKVDVTVRWTVTKPESVQISGYLFP